MRAFLRLLAVAGAVVTIVACSGNGCSCMEPIPGGFPPAERRAGAIQLRATASMFQFLDQEAAKIIPALLGGSATFDVPPSCSGSNKVCCTNPPQMCQLSLDFRGLQLTPTAPNLLKLDTDFVLKTVGTLPVEFLGSTCVISIDSTRSGSQTVKVTGDIRFPVDATRKTTSLEMSNTNIDIETGDIKFNEPGSGFLCTLIGLPEIETFVVNIFKGQLTSQIESTITQQTCMKCMQQSDCNSFAVACTDGVCVDADDKCVQEVGVSGRLDVGAMLSGFSPSTRGKMDIAAVLGGWAEADTGLSLGMLGGGMGAPHNACVPVVPPPAVMDVPASDTFKTDTLPDNTPYHLGVGIHRSHLDKLGWAAFDSGALCIAMGTPQQALLSASTIGLVVPSLDDLTRGDAPMFLSLRPAQPPSFRLGAGTFKEPPDMGGGPKQIDDPLLTVSLPELSIDFYAFVDDRFVRVMTLTADVELPVGLDVDADGALVPLLGELDAAFKNVRVTNVELLDEDPGALAQAFPMLLAVAGGAIGGGLGPIALPDIMGLRPKIVRIGASDPDGDGAPQFLALHANLESAAALKLAAETEAHLAALELPATREFAVSARTGQVPRARVDVGGSFPGGGELEFSYRLDGGLWAPWQRTAQLVVSDARLWLQGHHSLEVRARAVGLPDSVDRTPVTLDLLVDTVPPAGTFDVDPADPGRVLLQARDRVSPAAALRFRVTRPGEAPGEWTAEPHAALGAGRLDEWVVEAIDEAGNIGVLAFHGRTTAPASGGCDCQVGGGRAPGALMVLAFVGLLGLLLRRRWRGLALLVALAAAPLAACDRGLAPGEYANPLSLIGRWHDTAARDGVIQMSGYDENLGDLVYARVEDRTQPIRWQIIDGVDPLGERQGEDKPRYGVLEPGPDVGRWNAIALTRGGDPRIAYADLTEGAVKWAVGPGHFRLGVVETAPPGVLIGAHIALSLDAEDVPTIAYAVTAIPQGDRFRSELRVAVGAVREPAGPEQWSIQVVDGGPVSCAGLCAANQACVLDEMVNGMPNGDPAYSRCVVKDTAECPTACADDEACVGATCVAALGKPKQNSLIEGFGLFTRALRAPDGQLVLVYYDSTQGDLKVARANGAGFDVQIVDGGDPLTDVGQFCAAAFDENGTLHVAYQDALSDRLLYRTVAGATFGPVEVVDDGLRPDGVHPVGAGAAMVVRGGAPLVAYQDQRLSDLLLATRGGSWSSQAMSSGDAGFGFSTRLAADDKGTYLTQFVYDRAAEVLGAVRIDLVP